MDEHAPPAHRSVHPDPKPSGTQSIVHPFLAAFGWEAPRCPVQSVLAPTYCTTYRLDDLTMLAHHNLFLKTWIQGKKLTWGVLPSATHASLRKAVGRNYGSKIAIGHPKVGIGVSKVIHEWQGDAVPWLRVAALLPRHAHTT